MKKTIMKKTRFTLSILVLILLIQLFSVAAFAHEVEQGANSDETDSGNVKNEGIGSVVVDATITEQDNIDSSTNSMRMKMPRDALQKMGLENMGGLLGGLRDDLVNAQQHANEARAYFHLTHKILTAEAVIAFFQENYPDADVTIIADYKEELERLRAGLNDEIEYDTIKKQAEDLITDARHRMKELIEEYNIDSDELHTFVNEYKEAVYDDDEAQNAWVDARVFYIRANSDLIIERLNSIVMVFNYYLGEGSASTLERVIAELEVVTEDMAQAVTAFDEERFQIDLKETTDLLHEAKHIIHDLWKEIHRQWKEKINAAKER